MDLKIGIIGLPNVGKSTLFNALLKRQIADASNYPFCTIEPNIGVVEVPDDRLPVLAKIVHTEKIVPAIVKFVDIAGIVKGASEGQGLGNKFLSHIREVNVICHVVRYFKDENVVHVAGEINPKSDQEVINSELILADLETLTKNNEQRTNSIKPDDKTRNKISAINKLYEKLNQGVLAKDVELTDEEREAILELQLLTMKPVIFVRNVDENQIINKNVILESHASGTIGSHIDSIASPSQDLASLQNDSVSICAKTESELADLAPDEQKEYLMQLGLEKSGLERLIQQAYKTLGLLSFLTAGEIEVRAWTIINGTKAPQAAGTIHTDFEKAFIKAETASFEDFVKYNGWHGCEKTAKSDLKGKNM